MRRRKRNILADAGERVQTWLYQRAYERKHDYMVPVDFLGDREKKMKNYLNKSTFKCIKNAIID